MNIFDFFRKKPKFNEEQRKEIINRTFEAIKQLSKPASIAQIGGFRPSGFAMSSRFSGDFVMLENEEWPSHEGRYLQSILQINTGELPFVPGPLQAYKLITIFIDEKELPFESPIGQGWLIRCYDSLEGLVRKPNPIVKTALKSFEIKWELDQFDAPDWQDADALIDLKEFNRLDEIDADFERIFSHHERTKIGGWPSLIQAPLEMGSENCLIQIGSEEKANCNWVDGGNIYLGLIEGAWKFECQFF